MNQRKSEIKLKYVWELPNSQDDSCFLLVYWISKKKLKIRWEFYPVYYESREFFVSNSDQDGVQLKENEEKNYYKNESFIIHK